MGLGRGRLGARGDGSLTLFDVLGSSGRDRLSDETSDTETSLSAKRCRAGATTARPSDLTRLRK